MILGSQNRRGLWLVCFSLLCLEPQFHLAEALAADLSVEARLIWGTNDKQSPDPKHKSIDTPLTQRLAKLFTWKYYFEVNRKEASIVRNATRKIELSDKCLIEMKSFGDSRVEVKLFGSGKFLSKTVESIPKGDWLVLAGPSENKTAWFVVLKAIKPK
jgi:hypothetical protein